MDGFGRAAVTGLCVGFLWGIGCSLAFIYSIYLAGYRKAVKESIKKVKPERYTKTLEKLLAKRAKKAAASANAGAPPQE
jgi:hypothetical protein